MIVGHRGAPARDDEGRASAVLLTEQNHRLALDVADRVYFIEKGQVVWAGTSAEAADPEVIGRYLAV